MIEIISTEQQKITDQEVTEGELRNERWNDTCAE